MSAESSDWLNKNTLVGFTDKRGKAWHWRESDQGDEPNHYTGAIPVDDVVRRLFSWEGIEQPVLFRGADGEIRESSKRKVILRSDTYDDLGAFAMSYRIHQYQPWLIGNVEAVTDGTAGEDIHIGSAGLLQGGGQAWVQFELPETMQAEGVEYRPFICAATSMNGTLPSMYFTGAQLIICDNTLRAGVGNAATMFKVRHSVNSLSRIGDARDALGIIHSAAGAFEDEVRALLADDVSEREWAGILDRLTAHDPESARAATEAEKKRDAFNDLWNRDERVEPFRGTAFGVLQAFNTWNTHVQGVRGNRFERNMGRIVSGEAAALDRAGLNLLAEVRGEAVLA